MSAKVIIHTDDRVENALTVPVQAVIRVSGKVPRFRCYVKTAAGAEARDVTVGLSNEKMVEIKTGLSEGDEVVTNPKVLENGASQPDEQESEASSPGKTPAKDKVPGKSPAKDKAPGSKGKR